MASGDNDEMGFQHSRETMTNFSSLQMGTNGGDPFFGSGWDPVVSLSQSQNFGASSMVSQPEVTNSHYPVVMGHQGINSTSQYSQYPCSSGFVDLVPKLPCFGSGNFTEMVGSFGPPQCSEITSSVCATSYAPNQEGCNERTSANGTQSNEKRQVSEDGGVDASLSEKGRKRMSESIYSLSSHKNAEEESQKDTSRDGSDFARGQDKKKLKTEENVSPNSRGKQVSKQGKETSQCGEARKEDYIHVRARRGQATNSHSLAERVRREKISERMRLLQELVPGCNKITGKAVMLDEIINYVQSLQQQVEFLSMKLATVNPELNIGMERLLSKDILPPQGRDTAILGLGAGINSSSHPFPPGVFPGSLSNIPSSNAHFPPFPQTAVNNEFQSLFQMGADSASMLNSLGPNGDGDDPLPGWLSSK